MDSDRERIAPFLVSVRAFPGPQATVAKLMSAEGFRHNTVSLSGPATLYELAEIRDMLLASFSERKDLFVDLETSGPWDLAGLQLLISAVAFGRKAGLSVRLVNVPGVCTSIAERCGVSEWLNQVSDSFA